MINPTRIAELAANLRAKWLTEEANALEKLAAEVEELKRRATLNMDARTLERWALERAATVLIGVNTSARNQCLGALAGQTEDEYLRSIGIDPDA